jgi:PKD repeat protein
VTVNVIDTAGLSSRTSTQVVVSAPPVDAPPVAALSLTPVSGTVPVQVTADASGSTDTDATPIATYAFDWGDGAATGTQPGASATHTYSVPGTYTVTVSVVDMGGLSSQATGQIVVSAPPANIVGNPGFETNLSGWNNSGTAGVTLTQVAAGHSGTFAAQVTNTGTASVSCTLNDAPNWVATTSASTYAGSLWVRADAAGTALKLRFREYNGSTLIGSKIISITLSTTWQQVSVSYAAQVVGSTLDLNAYVVSAPPGVCFYADDASITIG